MAAFRKTGVRVVEDGAELNIASGRLSPLISTLTRRIVMSALHPKADVQNARVKAEMMSAIGR